MAGYEYKVVPAPTRGLKGKGIKGAEARFAHALEIAMNDLATDGWEYQRAETLPSMERAGLTGTATEWRNLLVFRRALSMESNAPEPHSMEGPTEAERSAPGKGATNMLPDNGVEGTSEVAGMTSSLSNLAGLRRSETSDS